VELPSRQKRILDFVRQTLQAVSHITVTQNNYVAIFKLISAEPECFLPKK
jgi:hypothetical protein